MHFGRILLPARACLMRSRFTSLRFAFLMIPWVFFYCDAVIHLARLSSPVSLLLFVILLTRLLCLAEAFFYFSFLSLSFSLFLFFSFFSLSEAIRVLNCFRDDVHSYWQMTTTQCPWMKNRKSIFEPCLTLSTLGGKEWWFSRESRYLPSVRWIA